MLAWVVPFLAKFSGFAPGSLAGVGDHLFELLFPVFTEIVVDKVIVEKNVGLLEIILLGMGVALVFVQARSLAQEYLLSFAAVRLDTSILDFLSRQCCRCR